MTDTMPKTAAFGPLGEVIFARTYARELTLPDGTKRLERWPETVERVADYSAELAPITPTERTMLQEAILNLRVLPSGRTLWVGGTDHARHHPMSNYNCAFTSIMSVQDYHDMVIMLMNGVGVGFGLRENEVERFKSQGDFRPARTVTLEPYEYVGQPSERESTQRYVLDGGVVLYFVGDSREGWATFSRDFLSDFLFGGYKEIVVNFDAVRPEGTPLKTFGGQASGPGALMDFVNGVVKTFAHPRQAALEKAQAALQERRWGEAARHFARAATVQHPGITDVALLDTGNLIGRMVVAGGKRRSAQIGLGSPESEPFVTAKTGPWYVETPWRSQSNNSICFEEKPTRERLTAIFESVLEYGEPGFINAAAARRRRADWTGLNPCAEILLGGIDGNGAGFCNVVTVILTHYAKSGVDWKQLESDVRLITRHALRITMVTMTGVQEKWDIMQKADRLIGVSFTGYADFVDAKGEEEGLRVLAFIRRIVRQEADDYAEELDVPAPLLATTVKPEGTLSLLAGASSGVHDAFAPHYIRRVRIKDSDPVAKALNFMGVPVHPDPTNAGTLVFEFPLKSNAQQKASEKPAVDQLRRYFDVMKAYVEHNASITVTISPDEVPEVVDMLLENWDDYVGVSFLKKDDASYPLMPLEAISAAEYHTRVTAMPDLKTFPEILEVFGGGETDLNDLGADCAGGACPIR